MWHRLGQAPGNWVAPETVSGAASRSAGQPGEAGVPASTTSFAALMGRLRSGEDAAAQEVFQRFVRQLVALARRQVALRLAHRMDPEDVVQSAFKSFFVRHRAGKLEAENWNGLWNLLTLITLRKCADRVAYLRAERRDVGREVHAAEGREPPWQQAPDREPRPQEAAILAETVELLWRSVQDDERPVLELSLQGWTAVEISLRLGRALRSVQRLRERIRKRLVRMGEAN
jgi:RNA polymerase sigma-70 factor, ECF subfamily